MILKTEDQIKALKGINTDLLRHNPISIPKLLKAQELSTAREIIQIVSDLQIMPNLWFLEKYPDWPKNKALIMANLPDYLKQKYGTERKKC
jgi:hypothetical protein